MAGLAAGLYLSFSDDDTTEAVPGLEDSGSTADAEIGPSPGTDLTSYTRGRRSALASAEGDRVAVVSFAGYLTETDARGLVEGTEVGVVLVAFPADAPMGTADLEAVRADLVSEAQAQLPELKSIVPTVEDPEFVDFYTSEIARYEQILSTGNTPEVVFAAIVRADADVLRSISQREGVRLVDVGDSDVVRHGAALAGLRPEETSIAGDPGLRPVSPG